MELGLEGKVAIVTGASRGIGAAIARELAGEGCRLVIAARSGEALEEVAGELRASDGDALVHAADLREPENPARLVDAALAAFGRIDVVVANAGAAKRGGWARASSSGPRRSVSTRTRPRPSSRASTAR